MKNLSLNRHVVTLFSLVLLLCVPCQYALAMRAGAFYLPVKDGQNAAFVDLSKDHYSVEIVGGRISSKDGFIDTITNKNSTLIGSFKQTIFIGGGKQLAINKVYQEEDIRSKIDRPIQTGVALLDRIPGDYQSTINVRYVVNRDKRLSDVFNALEQEQSALTDAGSDVLASPWLGYAKVATRMMETLFNAGKDKFPIEWDGHIQTTTVVKDGMMQPHYLVLIAPQKDNDQYYNSIKTSELSVDGNKLMRTVKKPNGEDLPPSEVERTYIILKVSKSDSFNIKRLIDSSDTTWGAFGRKQFRGKDDTAIKKEELNAFATSLLNQLETFGDLLQEDVYFSSYDKAVALVYYAGFAKDRVKKKCDALKVPTVQCPTASLDNHITDYLARHGIQPDSRKDVDVKKMVQQIRPL